MALPLPARLITKQPGHDDVPNKGAIGCASPTGPATLLGPAIGWPTTMVHHRLVQHTGTATRIRQQPVDTLVPITRRVEVEAAPVKRFP